MLIEERIEQLEQQNVELKVEVGQLKSIGFDQFLTPKELAELMKCSLPTVHRRLKSGEIYATRKLGDPKIPISQFYSPEESKKQTHKYLDKLKPRENAGEITLKELVFGK